MAIHEDKRHLWRVMRDIRRICESLGLELNERKTKVTKLSRGFVMLKKRFSYSNGKVIVRPCRSAITRERRKLKRQANLVKSGVMGYDAFERSYASWRGSVISLDAHRSTYRMDELFRSLSESIERGA